MKKVNHTAVYGGLNIMQICGSNNSKAREFAMDHGAAFTPTEQDPLSFMDLEENDGGLTGFELRFSAGGEYVIPFSYNGKLINRLSGTVYSEDPPSVITFMNDSIDLSAFRYEGSSYNRSELTIKGYAGSTAQEFAERNDLRFEAIPEEETDLSFQIIDGCAAVVVDSIKKNIVIPETWRGMPVTAIMAEGYAPYVTSLTIPASVTAVINDEGMESGILWGPNDPEQLTVYGVSGSYAEYIAEHKFWRTAQFSAINDENPNINYHTETDENGNQFIIAEILDDEECSGDLVIPEEVDGVPVTALYMDIYSARRFDSITIPRSVDQINWNTESGSIGNLVIYCDKGSYAMNFAKEHGLKYRIKGLPEEAHFVYEYRDGKVGVCDLRVNMDEVVIPSEMYGKPIEWVSLSEPYNSVTIPKTVNEIELGNTATIIGHKGSYAERYARERRFRFVALPEEESIDGITYALYNDHAEILSVTAGDDELITLPSTIKGKPVTSFRWNFRRPEGAYWDYSNRYTLVIPDTVENIYSEEEDTRLFDRITVRCSEGTAAYDFASENDMIIDEGYHYQEESYIQYSTYEDENGRYAVAYVTIDGTNDIVIPNYHGFYNYSTEENPSGETLRLPVKRVELRRGSGNYGYGDSYSYSYSGSRVKITFPKYVEDIRTEYNEGSRTLSDFASEISGYAGTYVQQLAYEEHIKFNALDGYDHTTSYFQNGFYESYEGSGSVRYSSFDIVHATIPEYIKGTKITRVNLSCCNALKSITFLGSDIDVEGCYLEECLALEEIKGYRGSTAEAYAAEHDLKFTELPLPNEIPSYLGVSDGTVTRCDMNAVDVFIPESYVRNEYYYGSDRKNKITEISADAFRGCTKLRSVTIPGSVTSIPEGLFSDCEQLAEIHGVAGGEVEEYAISHGLTFVEVSGAPSYYSVVVHEVRDDQEGSGSDYSGEGTSATSYGDQKRRYEAKLLAVDPDCYDLVIPEKVPYYFTEEADLVMIGDNAFYGMKNVSKVVVPESIREYDEYYGSNSESSIEELILPKGIERIGGVSVPNITILDPETEILGELRAQTITGYYMSTAYDYAKEHDIWFNAILDENDPAPEGFTYELFPEPYTFSGSYGSGHDHFVEPGIRITGIGSAEEVEIPAMINNVPVREITGEALEQNSNLKKLTVAAMDCQFPDSYSQSTVQEIVGYLDSSAMTYAESKNLPFFDITAENQPQIPEGTRFYHYDDHVRMEIPYDVQLDQATLTIPESMYGLPVAEVSISGKGTFDEIIAPESVEHLSIYGTTVGKLTIYNSQCEIYDGDSPVEIGQIHAPLDSAASRFAAENHIDFYDLEGTNYSCPEYLEYYLTDDIDGSIYVVIAGLNKESTEIPENLVIPDSIYGVPVRCIDDYAFEGCSDIKTVTIPASVTAIGKDAFYDCSSLTDLYIEGDLEKVPDNQICDEGVMLHGGNGSKIWEYAVDHRVPFTGSDGAVYYPPEDLEYKYDGETMGFAEYSGTETDITIPSMIYGVPVEKICEYKTNGNDTVKKITIPSSVKTIEGSPFVSFSALEDIYFEGDLEDVPEYLICRDNVMLHGENGSKIWEYAVNNRVPFSSSDGEVYYPIEELSYQLDGETMTITYCGGKDLDTNDITIPETIYGVPVTAIRGNASHIDKLTIPRSITEISGISSDITIRGYMGSAAEDYAKTNGNEFVAIDLEGIPDDLYIKWVWGDLNVPGTPTATVVLRSFEDETFIQELSAEVTVERKEPTCEEAGYKEFTGSIMLYGIEYTDTATVKLKATGHDHYLTDTVWSEDHSSCTMAYSCHNCNMTPVIVEADVQHIVTPATCTERGSEEFYAEIQVDGKKLTASDGFALPAEGHDYQPEWSWSEDCSQCQAVLKCTKCGETVDPIAAHITHSDEESSPAACTESGLDVFIAEVTYEVMTYTEKKSVVLEALGHDHKVNRWQWSEDHSQCSAELKCTRCGHLADPIQAQVQRTEIPADCVNEGTITYTATITLNGEVLTDIQTEVIPAEGHSYQAQWEWAEDNSSCVAKLVCSKCGDTHSYTAAVTSSVALEPTYDDPGIMEHTAVVKVDGETYTDTVQSEIPALERTSIENARLNIGNTSFEYNGQEQTLTIASVKLNGVKLTEGVDYIVSGNKASESGDYSVVVTGIGAYKGTITRPWSIYKKYIVNCTVNDYTSCYIYTDKAHCTVTAEEVEGKFFSHWRLADDENSFLSSRQSYTFRVVCDTDIEAVYVDSQEEVLDKPAIVITSVNAAQNRITYEVTRSVPDGYTVVSNGILYGTSKLLFADADPETRDQLIRFTDDEGSTELKEKVHMSQSGVNTNQGYYAYTLNIGDHNDLKVYLRGYMILKD
ncbi:MAG: leucine-rich repeat protein, partial [Ruminococcus sp.]|nr:leucine-rich repeat protein [Ruminococcus sp.]